MGHPEPPFNGACMCGSIQIQVTAPPLLTLACHCRGCQKFTASAFSLTTMFPAGSVHCTGALITGGLGTNGRMHYFCKSCLNFVYSQIGSATERVNLRTSMLEEAASFVPFVEVMTEEKMPWVSVPVAHSFARYPETQEQLQSLMDDYGAT